MRKDYQDRIKSQEMKSEDMAELMKDMGKKWSSLTHDQKDLFVQAADHDKKRYEGEMQEFQVNGGTGKSIQDYDAQRPKKWLSAYMIFVRETRPKIVKELKEKEKEENEEGKFPII
jgi:hypothetical protein